LAGRDGQQHLPAGRQVIKRRLGSAVNATTYWSQCRALMLKAVTSAVNATTYWSQCRALMLKAVTHNVLILYAPTEPSRQAA